jgi:hypothetical protein
MQQRHRPKGSRLGAKKHFGYVINVFFPTKSKSGLARNTSHIRSLESKMNAFNQNYFIH